MTDPSPSSWWRRRRVLAAIGAGSLVGVAGCVGGGESDGDGDGDGEDDVASPDDDADGGEPSPFLVDHPGDEPQPFESDHMCGVCTMGVTSYDERNAQLAHETGDGMMFCSPGCLFAYYVAPDHFDGPDSDVVGVWVTDFDTGDLIDGFEAYYALEHDDRRADDPMGVDPRVYEDEDLAVAYVEEYDDLGEDDVITFSEVDEDVARIYRSSRL
ncbi:nitrous oxide reductase accessory protein NosL [Halobiforma nitratireducens]|uniref:Lipoprotein n=1 Tax=Halobiforma nitratireducens JCM 10879 TaxID=1227454 RepID=M0LTP2_9EURY|nr:nitrous oxide reductase accessory protein NosL [Halobiforma nitratireducens]EMA35470.1 lipoprotein [Halobiforma nitratireducens JCM 10879]